MSKDFITKHPRLVFLSVGLLILVGVSLFQRSVYDSVLEEKNLYIEELKSTITTKESTIETLTTYSKKLEQSTKTVRVVKPDGTIEEVMESNTKSETDIRNQVMAEYNEKVQEQVRSIVEEINKTTKESNKLTLSGAIDTDLNKYMLMDYKFSKPFSVIGGIRLDETNKTSYIIGIGWEF